jgi:hypothetical protein
MRLVPVRLYVESCSVPMPASGSRRVELRVARIGAAAALLGAIIGAFGAGVPVLISTDLQIAATSEESLSSFLREERKAAYSDFLSKSQAYLYRSYPVILGEASLVDFSRNKVEWDNAISDLYLSFSNVRLVGSPEVASAAEKVIERVNNFEGAIWSYVDAAIGTPSGEAAPLSRSSPSEIGDRQQDAIDIRNEYAELNLEFEKAARIDLGVDPTG